MWILPVWMLNRGLTLTELEATASLRLTWLLTLNGCRV